MKRVIELVVMTLLLLFFATTNTQAQAGNAGAPIIQIETVNVCDNGTTAVMALQYIGGSTTPTVLGYYDETGAPYTLSAGPLTIGACDGSGPGSSTQYNYQFMRMCDDGVPFLRLILFTNNTQPGVVTDYTLDMTTTYTVTGTVTDGPCVTSTTTTLGRTLSTTSGTLAANNLSFEICNQGTTIASTTTSAITTDLYPGECFSYTAIYNPVTGQFRLAPSVGYDANGGRLIIVTSN